MTIAKTWAVLATAATLIFHLGAAPQALARDSSAVVVMYHRFGETKIPSTNTSLEQLDAHIAELTGGGYSVLPISKIVAAIKAGEALPDRAVGIAIDDGFVSVHREAWPRFRKAGLPFTVFIATDYHDAPIRGYMTWNQIAEMAKDPMVEIGAHSAAHAHMAEMAEEAIKADLTRSMNAFKDKLGVQPPIFAYPFGEASAKLKGIVERAGFVAAFGQHSGAFSRRDDAFYLPRFAFNETYGDIGRFRTAVRALALPIVDVAIGDPMVTAPNPPPFAFSADPAPKGMARINCYSSNLGKTTIVRPAPDRIELRFEKPFARGRTRVNCTVPADGGRWYWFGYQFYVPK